MPIPGPVSSDPRPAVPPMRNGAQVGGLATAAGVIAIAGTAYLERKGLEPTLAATAASAASGIVASVAGVVGSSARDELHSGTSRGLLSTVLLRLLSLLG